MSNYGFPWPDMLRCDRFPADNDLCVGLQHRDDRPGTVPAFGELASKAPALGLAPKGWGLEIMQVKNGKLVKVLPPNPNVIL